MTCRRPITAAVVRCTQVRAALDHSPRDLHCVSRIAALLRTSAPRIVRNATSLRDLGWMLGHVPVDRPFPHVADHVEQPIPVRGKHTDWRGALVAVRRPILPGKLALPGIGEVSIVWEELVAPRVRRSIKASASRTLPLSFCWQRLPFPLCESLGVTSTSHGRPDDARARQVHWPVPAGVASQRSASSATSA